MNRLGFVYIGENLWLLTVNTATQFSADLALDTRGKVTENIWKTLCFLYLILAVETEPNIQES